MPALQRHIESGTNDDPGTAVPAPAGRPEVTRAPGAVADAIRRTGRGKVLFLAPQPFYEDRGTPIAVRGVLQALSELDFDVDLVTFPIGEPVELRGLNTIRVANPFGFRAVPIGFSGRKMVLDVAIAREAARRLARGNYACVHAVEEAAFAVVGPARRHGVPVLYDMQSNLPEQMAKSLVFRIPPVSHVLHASQRWLLRQVDSVVCSAGLESYVRESAPGTPVTGWQYPAMPLVADANAANALRRSMRISSDRPVVLYTGNFETYQGVGRLVDAMPLVLREIPEALFVLVGADGKGIERLPAAAEHLSDRGSLRVIDRQPRSAIPGFLALADIVVSPREAVGNLPLKVFDYMAAGKPIVATDTATHRAALSEKNACLVSPEASAMASGIVGLLRDPQRAADLGREARAYADEHLGWNEFRSRLEALYLDVIGASNAGS